MGFGSEVLLVPLFGHTLGHCGVAAQQGGGSGQHKSATASYLRVELETDGHPVSLLAAGRADDDALRRASLEQLRLLARDHGDEIDLFEYHDGSGSLGRGRPGISGEVMRECEGADMTAEDARTKLKSLALPAAAKLWQTRFFKTGPGQYGEGDTFIGINVPTLRTVSRSFRVMPLDEIRALLNSPVHEERHLALMILVLQVAKGDEAHRKRAFELYLSNTQFINNWDLVDCSAPQVVGGFLMNKPRKPLFDLTRSKCLWERRIAIVSTQHFIRREEFDGPLTISRLLLGDKEDLIHKAAGWMLREVGKKDPAVLEAFLDRHGGIMPRTMLRYAIREVPARPAACVPSERKKPTRMRELPMAADESPRRPHPRRPRPHGERRGADAVRLRLLLPQRQRAGGGVEGRPHRPPRP